MASALIATPQFQAGGAAPSRDKSPRRHSSPAGAGACERSDYLDLNTGVPVGPTFRSGVRKLPRTVFPRTVFPRSIDDVRIVRATSYARTFVRLPEMADRVIRRRPT
jgi:hypothetical protein